MVTFTLKTIRNIFENLIDLILLSRNKLKLIALYLSQANFFLYQPE